MHSISRLVVPPHSKNFTLFSLPNQKIVNEWDYFLIIKAMLLESEFELLDN